MNRAHHEAGQTLVEAALVMTAFMGLLLGMAGIGQSLFVRQTLSDRARMAARWGALNSFQPDAVRNMVLYGTTGRAPGQSAFFNLTPGSIDVSNPGCPGPSCRISVTIPEHGIRSVEPVDSITPGPLASTP